MLIFKGICIGAICLCLGGVIGWKARYFVIQEQGRGMFEGMEIQRQKDTMPKK